MDKQALFDQIKGGLIVSCQALEHEPLYTKEGGIMPLMAKAAAQSGAVGIRANTVRDITQIKEAVDLPVIGIIKKDYEGTPMYITVTMKEVDELVACGVDILAVQGTSALRPDGSTAAQFIEMLPEMRRVLHTDVHATYCGDPAAVSTEEVIFCYPGLKAIINYRIAHALLTLGVPIIPRMISEIAHSETGIDIHPGATIGEHFSIDHGTGVVIGATAIIGNNVKLYQGVTLGAKSFDYDEDNNPIKGIPRHPIIGDNVVIYSNTSVLGRIHIGNNAIIGGNIWVTDDVADNEKLTQAKADNILRLKQD